jgi:hypothetical protein
MCGLRPEALIPARYRPIPAIQSANGTATGQMVSPLVSEGPTGTNNTPHRFQSRRPSASGTEGGFHD